MADCEWPELIWPISFWVSMEAKIVKSRFIKWKEDLEKLEKRHMYITSTEFHQWLAFGSAIVGCTSCTDAHV